jgi:anti-sigma factor RsiW
MNHYEAWSKLDAYLDGELPAQSRWAVAAHVTECPTCREQLANLARMREITHDHLANVSPPPKLEERLRAALAAEPEPISRPKVVQWSPPSALRLVAVLAVLALGIALLSRAIAPTAGSPATLRTEVTLAHALFAQDTSKLDVVGDADAVNDWFREKAGFTLSVPQFAGFTLAGARLIVLDGQAVAQLVYQRDTDGAYLSLLRFKDRGVDLSGLEPVDGFAISQQGATSLITWTKGGERAVLVGELTEPEIRTLADDLATRPEITPPESEAPEATPPSAPGARHSRYERA